VAAAAAPSGAGALGHASGERSARLAARAGVAAAQQLGRLEVAAALLGSVDQPSVHRLLAGPEGGGIAHANHQTAGPRDRHVEPVGHSQEADAAPLVAPHQRDHDYVLLPPLEGVHGVDLDRAAEVAAAEGLADVVHLVGVHRYHGQ
jgi:hypothetical protein